MKLTQKPNFETEHLERFKRAADRIFAADDEMFLRVLDSEGDDRKEAIRDLLDWIVKTIQQGDA